MINKILIFIVLGSLIIHFNKSFAYIEGTQKSVTAINIQDKPPAIDGIIDDNLWVIAKSCTGFRQKEPLEGSKPTDSIEVKFFYDKKYLYVIARMFSGSQENIQSYMSRRDNTGNSERIIISLDTYNDSRTAYSFGVTASGVRFDYYHPSDAEFDRDYSWDPIWEAKAGYDSTGWCAELKMPFSQLRFNESKEQKWGLNINWWRPTLREDIYWVLIPKNETGWSSKMGILEGIEGIELFSRIELLPYITTNVRFNPNYDNSNPFDDEIKFKAAGGLDFKMGIGPNLTLDATVNPDFGQVEADPAVVNLTAYETYFQEKRPFFIEGQNLLSNTGPDYFYSRRIGAPPRIGAEGDYVNSPEFSTILMASKLTGRLESGLSLGSLIALTNKEYSESFNITSSSADKIAVQPLTLFNVLRVQQEFGEDASTLGIILTAVNRDNGNHTISAELTKQAYSGGSDWNIRFNKGEYILSGHLGFSCVNGTKEAMLRIQHSPVHYYQRLGQNHVKVDSNLRTLFGYTGSIKFSKNGGEHWLWGLSTYFESPGFEINDMGIVTSADDLNFSSWLTYRENKPGTLFYNYSLSGTYYKSMNFGLINLENIININSNFTFSNRSNVWLGIEYEFEGMSDDLTRGGPLMKTGWATSLWTGYSSDWSRQFKWEVNSTAFISKIGSWYFLLGGNISYQTSGNLTFSFTPWMSKTVDGRQFVATIPRTTPTTYFNRYIFACIEQKNIGVQFRINYAFTNDITLEFYAEPFTASGNYFNFGELKREKDIELRLYGSDGTTIVSNDQIYTVIDGTEEFKFTAQDFNVLSFRSNMVLRWEFLPGSTLFFVWQENKGDYIQTSRNINLGNLFDTFSAKGTHIFALKLSYWLPLN